MRLQNHPFKFVDFETISLNYIQELFQSGQTFSRVLETEYGYITEIIDIYFYGLYPHVSRSIGRGCNWAIYTLGVQAT